MEQKQDPEKANEAADAEENASSEMEPWEDDVGAPHLLGAWAYLQRMKAKREREEAAKPDKE